MGYVNYILSSMPNFLFEIFFFKIVNFFHWKKNKNNKMVKIVVIQNFYSIFNSEKKNNVVSGAKKEKIIIKHILIFLI